MTCSISTILILLLLMQPNGKILTSSCCSSLTLNDGSRTCDRLVLAAENSIRFGRKFNFGYLYTSWKVIWLELYCIIPRIYVNLKVLVFGKFQFNVVTSVSCCHDKIV